MFFEHPTLLPGPVRRSGRSASACCLWKAHSGPIKTTSSGRGFFIYTGPVGQNKDKSGR